MPRFIYEGPDGVLIAAGTRMNAGEAVEVTEAVAEKLRNRENITEISEGKASKAAKPAAAKPSGSKPTALDERRALVARAKELGIPASGKSDELAKAIADAEAAAAADGDDD